MACRVNRQVLPPQGGREAGDLVDTAEIARPRRQVLEAPLQRLQMGGRLLIADFEYKYTAHGDRYGWGMALYATPETWFGRDIAKVGRTPEESFRLLADRLSEELPRATRPQIVKLLS